ncbi:putative membrane protein [Salirhabdus euzebyi]|uniref:Putative membrane protein n=1 Tax=Salirhabdus euzebyi TaxID=394506 RepID=A0A841Q2D0_9BACI|nr:cytochrome c oxidase assembly protein [Salirhabdus euzebyi]MBB6452692.1 putative membrane protein [Salirhabdus euzebyi]
MENHHHIPAVSLFNQLILALPFILGVVLYVICVVYSNRTYKKWPISRLLFWFGGCFLAIITVLGPLAVRAHVHFPTHMIGHLFLGMLAPLLMVVAMPMTLLLRTLPVRYARLITKVLRSKIIGHLTNPIITGILNVGGLWIIYTTNLYILMHENILFHVVVHLHVFLAGYFFTISIIYLDPTIHRYSFAFRTIVFILALAGHGILSKYIYANPPNGVNGYEAEVGAMIMYYGGDLVDVILIVILFYQWYKATAPKPNAI